jgi:hypothetical protein
MMNTPVPYVAELTHVREVSLFGTADLAFWRDRLKKENLVPAESDGGAQFLVIAADSKYMGIRFRELSFSVLVAQDDERIRQDRAYLAHAWNSSRLFAFCERAFFSTPYFHGDVRLSTSFPPSIQLIQGGKVVFRAEMQIDASAPNREPSRSGEDGWEGPVFLPGRRSRKDRQGHLFFARIRGHTNTYPFLYRRDSVTIMPSPDSEIFQALIDSNFVGKEWAVREDATHARSKSYPRSEVFVEQALM